MKKDSKYMLIYDSSHTCPPEWAEHQHTEDIVQDKGPRHLNVHLSQSLFELIHCQGVLCVPVLVGEGDVEVLQDVDQHVETFVQQF